MSGAMRRIGEYLGLLEDTGRYDDYSEDYVSDQPTVPGRVEERRERRPAGVSDLADKRRRAGLPTEAAISVSELSRITTLQPVNYNEVRTVGEHFRDSIPVIMNLTDMDDADARRLVDFAAGLVFATRGTMERVTNKVFLLCPPNVSVAAEEKERLGEGGFFNQS